MQTGGITQLFHVLQEQKPTLQTQRGTWNSTLTVYSLDLAIQWQDTVY